MLLSFSLPPNCAFQHTAARRRLVEQINCSDKKDGFQHTAARRRLGIVGIDVLAVLLVSTHSRPKAAGYYLTPTIQPSAVSTHSRPKAAGWDGTSAAGSSGGFNTQPPEGGWRCTNINGAANITVSTHSRPKAAGGSRLCRCRPMRCFNTQPPEGGWGQSQLRQTANLLFQHTAARRRLVQF